MCVHMYYTYVQWIYSKPETLEDTFQIILTTTEPKCTKSATMFFYNNSKDMLSLLFLSYLVGEHKAIETLAKKSIT